MIDCGPCECDLPPIEGLPVGQIRQCIVCGKWWEVWNYDATQLGWIEANKPAPLVRLRRALERWTQ